MGLMHVICTNFALFTKTVVVETVSEIRQLKHHHVDIKFIEHLGFLNNNTNIHSPHKLHSLPDKDLSMVKYLGCINVYSLESNVSLSIQEAQDKISEYLYPCVIEFSLVAMTIFYILWASVKSRYDSNSENHNNFNRRRSQSIYISHDECTHFLAKENREINKFTIDCGKTTTGLFIGTFVLLITVRNFTKSFLII